MKLDAGKGQVALYLSVCECASRLLAPAVLRLTAPWPVVHLQVFRVPFNAAAPAFADFHTHPWALPLPQAPAWRTSTSRRSSRILNDAADPRTSVYLSLRLRALRRQGDSANMYTPRPSGRVRAMRGAQLSRRTWWREAAAPAPAVVAPPRRLGTQAASSRPARLRPLSRTCAAHPSPREVEVEVEGEVEVEVAAEAAARD